MIRPMATALTRSDLPDHLTAPTEEESLPAIVAGRVLRGRTAASFKFQPGMARRFRIVAVPIPAPARK